MTDRNRPNPQWQPGHPIQKPFDKTVALDVDQLPRKDVYRLMIDCIVPRPIAFISTINAQGIGNLAPFSFFNGVSSDPPTLVFACSRKRDSSKKDTLLNIEANREFVVNFTSEWMAEPMHQASADYPYGIDEMSKVGLTPLPSTRVKPPRVAESPVQMECELFAAYEIGPPKPGSSVLVVGRILVVHVAEAFYKDSRVQIDQLKPIARLGGDAYGRTSGIFEISRPKADSNP
jgi:flavin reductase (DIM6/NTAB) family NADH-FMN oxidoreductase RutF